MSALAGTQRLGVVPAFCKLGVVALHSMKRERALVVEGVHEAAGPAAPLQGKEGVV